MSDKPINEEEPTADQYIDPYGEEPSPDPMPEDLQDDREPAAPAMDGDAPTG